MGVKTVTEMPDLFRLAGHPLRWSLLRELAQSDRQVSELTRILGIRQSLVSYHLSQLRNGRLVSSKRSSADGRDAYYRIDLPRFRVLLAEVGGALHPGIAPEIVDRPVEVSNRPSRVLFLCTGNSSRSQIAEALVRRIGGEGVDVVSAGTQPKPVHDNTWRILEERGLVSTGHSSKSLEGLNGQPFDYVITLCDRAREVCPEFPGDTTLIHWSIPDPDIAGRSGDETYQAFVQVATEIEVRVRFLLSVIGVPLIGGTV